MLTAKAPPAPGRVRHRSLFLLAAAGLVLCTCSRPDPPFTVAEDLFDQEIPGTLGLPEARGEHTLLHQASPEGRRYSHHANLIVYRDRLRAMWSSGLGGENENAQLVAERQTEDGVHWTPPRVLVGDPDGASGPRSSLASGYHIAGDTLIVYSLTVVDEDPSHPENTLLARASGDGETWGAPQPIAQGFFLGGPQRLPGGQLLLGGRWPTGHPRVLYSDSSDGIRGWKDAALPRTAAFVGAYPEPSWFRRDDGTLVMLLRTRVGLGRLHASTSADGGRTWSRPVPTDFPDATARIAAGNLPDGTAFVISNPSRRFGRMPLTVALSSDGRRFDRALVIRGGETKPRFPGRHKWPGWQYPSAVVWNDQLFVAYSINKEDIGVTRIPLGDLLRGSERQGTH